MVNAQVLNNLYMYILGKCKAQMEIHGNENNQEFS